MTNELIITDKTDFDEIAKITGQDGAGYNGPALPRLKVNSDYEDDDGNTLKPGTFETSFDGERVFSEKPVFRAFINAYQYNHWDPDANSGNGGFINRSVIFKNFRDEAIDEKGGIKCGKLTKAQLEGVSPEVIEQQRQIKCFRLVYGTVMMPDAVNVRGEKKPIKDWYPVLLRVRGTNFSPIGEVFEAFSKARKPIYMHGLTLSSTKKKQGTNTYFVIGYEPDWKTTLSLTEGDFALLKNFQELINEENRHIIDKHNKVIKGGNYTKEATEVLDALDEDLNDDLVDL